MRKLSFTFGTLFALVMAAAAPMWAQGVRYDNVVLGPRGGPAAGATISVYDTSGSGTVAIAYPDGAVESGNTVTITTTAAHGLNVGQTVSISDTKVQGYEGVWTITKVPSSTTFTYTNTEGDLGPSGGGTVSGLVATVYGDEELTEPVTNPFRADSLGNFGFWAPPGHYVVQIYGPGIVTRTMDVFLPCDPSSGAGCGSQSAAGDGVIFVSTSGSDTNNGLARGNAKATIQAALNALPGGSGTVYLGSGTWNLSSTVAMPGRANLEGNGKDKTILKWTGASGGTVIQASDWSYSHMGGFKVDGGGTAGIGINLTSDGSSPSIEDVIHDVWLVNMNGSPGDDLYVGSTSSQNYEIAQDTFRGILLGSATNGVYQDGTQTVDDTYQKIDQDTAGTNMLNLRNGSASIIGLEAGNWTTTIRVSPTFTWLYAYDVEIETGNAAPVLLEADSSINSFPRNFSDLRILWSGSAGGHIIEDDQAGYLTLTNVVLNTFTSSNSSVLDINPATGPSGGRVFLTENNLYLAQSPAVVSRSYSYVQFTSMNSGSVLNTQTAFAASNSLINTPNPAFTLDRDSAGHSSILGFTLGGTTPEGGIGGTPGVSGEVSLFGLKTNGNVLTEVARLGADFSTPEFTLQAPLNANNFNLNAVATATVATLVASTGGTLGGTFTGTPTFSGNPVTFSSNIVTPRIYLEGTGNAHMVTDATADRAWTFPDADGAVALNVISGTCTISSGSSASCSFPATYTTAPVCVGTDTTTVAAVRVTNTTSAITVYGTTGDAIAWICAPAGAVAGYTP